MSEGTTQPAPRRDLTALVIPVVLVAIGGFLLYGTEVMVESGDGGLFGARTFPLIVAVLCLLVALLMTIDVLRPRRGGPGEAEEPEASNWPALGTAIGGVVLFIVTLEWVGWILAATALFAIVAVGLGNRRYLTCVLAGLAVASVIQLVFSGILGVSLPAGFVGAI